MRRTSLVLVSLVVALASATIGCSSGGGAVAQSEVEQKAATKLAEATGQPEPEVSCPGDLPAEVDATMECELTAEGDDAVYPVTIEVTSIEDDTVNFDVEVGEPAAAE